MRHSGGQCLPRCSLTISPIPSFDCITSARPAQPMPNTIHQCNRQHDGIQQACMQRTACLVVPSALAVDAVAQSARIHAHKYARTHASHPAHTRARRRTERTRAHAVARCPWAESVNRPRQSPAQPSESAQCRGLPHASQLRLPVAPLEEHGAGGACLGCSLLPPTVGDFHEMIDVL